MHIPDGLLPAQVCLGGYGVTGLVTWYSLRQINRQPDPTEGIPKASLLAAAFFIASSIHIPIPPTSVHFVLNGLLGTLLGYYAFPAILIGLLFQAIAFGHGGLTTLGVNATIMGIPALIAYQIFQLRSHWGRSRDRRWSTGLFAFLAGSIGLGLAVLFFFGIVIGTIPAGLDVNTERAAVFGLMLAHIPLIVLEGIFTTMLALFLLRVKPELLTSTEGSGK
ncbi:cobalt transporter CbiM [Candidatus Gracilibacteria bacterium]|nr:cobalt transporter CbiM [Candidatus Gracilibacteria bacterium]